MIPTPDTNPDADLDSAIDRLLATPPRYMVPADFAARVAAAAHHLPAPAPHRSPVSFGLSITIAGAALLLPALVATASHAPTLSRVAFLSTNLLLSAELLLITLGVSWWRSSSL